MNPNITRLRTVSQKSSINVSKPPGDISMSQIESKVRQGHGCLTKNNCVTDNDMNNIRITSKVG